MRRRIRRYKHEEYLPSVNSTATPMIENCCQGSFSIRGERLPSCVPAVYFTVGISGLWRYEADMAPEHQDLAVLSRHHLREQARRILAHYSVLDPIAAQDAVNVAMARQAQSHQGLTATGVVHVTVRRRDRMLALEHLRTEQRGDVERQELHRHIAFLHRILSDPDQCRVWWIDRYPDRLGDLKLLATEVQELKPPHKISHDMLRDEVIRFVDQLLTDIRTPQQREILLRAFTQTLQTLGIDNNLQSTASDWLLTIVQTPEATTSTAGSSSSG